MSAADRFRALARAFYERPPATVACALVGKYVIRLTADGALTTGRIVETEAYLASDDPASHSHRGQTKRNASMFGPPGHAYVYTIHTRWCLNAVTQSAGVGSAVLIRAVEPLLGIEHMQQRRGVEKLRDLARGPGRLCGALAIDRAQDGWDLTRGEQLWIAEPPDAASANGRVAAGPRIGISSAQELPLRFFLADCPFVSGTRAQNSPAKDTPTATKKRRARKPGV